MPCFIYDKENNLAIVLNDCNSDAVERAKQYRPDLIEEIDAAVAKEEEE